MAATRLGIDNTPPPSVIPSLVAVAANICQPVRDHFKTPFSPSSWYRCAELNEAIGGAVTSQHIQGEAVDIEIPTVSNLDLARWIEAHLEFDQLILEFYERADPHSGWVHVSYIDDAARRRGEVLTIGRSGATAGLPQTVHA